MTDQEIIKKLATEFMGWHTKVWQNGEADFHWEDTHGNHVAKFSTIPWGEENPELTWNPLHDPVACVLVLDKIERRGWCWQWSYDWETTSCIIFKRPGDGELSLVSKLGSAIDDNRYRAVCVAALAACGVTE